jgi:DNA-binding HxlR family transcriptional regulator
MTPGDTTFTRMPRLLSSVRKLTRNGMVRRRVLGGSPPGVEYALTPLGRSLQKPFAVLYEWTLEHIDTTQRHQQAYDDDL